MNESRSCIEAVSDCVLGRNLSPSPSTIFSEGESFTFPRLNNDVLGSFKVANIKLVNLFDLLIPSL